MKQGGGGTEGMERVQGELGRGDICIAVKLVYLHRTILQFEMQWFHIKLRYYIARNTTNTLSFPW